MSDVVDVSFAAEELVVPTTILVWAAEEEDIIGKFLYVAPTERHRDRRIVKGYSEPPTTAAKEVL